MTQPAVPQLKPEAAAAATLPSSEATATSAASVSLPPAFSSAAPLVLEAVLAFVVEVRRATVKGFELSDDNNNGVDDVNTTNSSSLAGAGAVRSLDGAAADAGAADNEDGETNGGRWTHRLGKLMGILQPPPRNDREVSEAAGAEEKSGGDGEDGDESPSKRRRSGNSLRRASSSSFASSFPPPPSTRLDIRIHNDDVSYDMCPKQTNKQTLC